MFFQRVHSVDSNYFRFERFLIYSEFPEHTHRSFEFFCQTKGKTKVVIDGKSYIVNEGEAVLIFPFQLHSYESIEHGECSYCLFSPDMVAEFFSGFKGMLPADNKFNFVLPPDMREDNVYLCRAFTYLICGEFERQKKKKIKVSSSDDDILVSLLLYVENNYCGQCSLSDVANMLGYDYSYVSKQFKNKVGMPFNRYVNLLRIRKSQHIIKSSDMNFSEIMLKCGFTSLRSFDRNFRSVVGMSPSEYKERGVEIDNRIQS